MPRLTTPFFARSALDVARELLGKRLCHQPPGQDLVAGWIVETEAYCAGETRDAACHAARNNGQPTQRTRLMFGPPGYAYVYFNYGIHWLFNITTESDGKPGAVLIRALEPTHGLTTIAKRRQGMPARNWTNGPAKLTQALAITGSHNGLHLCAPDGVIWVEDGPDPPLGTIVRGPRIGLGQTPEPWLSLPWRFWLEGNRYVSR